MPTYLDTKNIHRPQDQYIIGMVNTLFSSSFLPFSSKAFIRKKGRTVAVVKVSPKLIEYGQKKLYIFLF